MKTIDLNLSSPDFEGDRRQDGIYAVYDTAENDVTFELGPFSPELGPGLYCLAIAMLDPASSAVFARLRLERENGYEQALVAVQIRSAGIDLVFALQGGERSLRLALSGEAEPLLSIGPARLRRVSTTLWRAKAFLGWFRSSLGQPQGIWGYVGKVMEAYRKGGWAKARFKAAEEFNAAIWAERRPFDQRMDQVLRQTAAANDLLLKAMAREQTSKAASLSIVVPLFRTPKPWLAQLVESLARQTDKTFEAIFVLDGPQPDLAANLALLLDDAFAHRTLVLEANKGVSAATNAGIRAANGEFVLVVDHDDVLECHLVEAFRRASAIEAADIYFADEAITDEAMRAVRYIASRGQFDIRHYLSHPYIVHPIFVRRSIAEEAGLLDETLTISHDVDFFLRAVSKARSVVHLPMVLYFWRTSTRSLGHSAAERVLANSRRAAESFLSSWTGWSSFEVRPGINFNELDIRPPLPPGARVAIVIPTKNGHDILKQCLDSIHARAASNRVRADIVVIDHQSDDPATRDLLERERQLGRIDVVEHIGPWNYSAINNAGIRKAVSGRGYSHVVLMNNDIELVTEDWLDRMAAQFSWGDVGVVGCCLLYPDGRVQHGGVVVGLVGAADHVHRFEAFLQRPRGARLSGHLSSLVATRDYSAVTAALMMVSLDLFEAVGGLDETLAVGFNDTDLCLRIGELGFHTTYVGGVVALHHESITRKSTEGLDHPEDTERFLSRYARMVEEGDPYLGAQWNWTQTRAQFSSTPQKAFKLRTVRLPARPG